MKSILVTGGAGFIGSHTCLSLIKKGYYLYVIDSFVNSSHLSLSNVVKILEIDGYDAKRFLNIIKGDIKNKSTIRDVFLKSISDKKPIQSIIHFAGLKSVAESVKKPSLYWETNLLSSLNLIELMIDFNCLNIVFSSSATVYGLSNKNPIKENGILNPYNPYGNTKLAIEKLLNDVFQSHKTLKVANLRYFNPVGAHPSGFIGEDPKGIPNNIFPIIAKVAIGKSDKLNVFGNDWPTFDGTGIRDYIHVMDLAEGHVAAMEYLFKLDEKNININLGTGIGTSVFDLISTFKKVNKIELPFKVVGRRNGDIGYLVANNSLAKSVLNWEPSLNLEEMCIDGWNWQKNNPNGFQN